MNPIFLATEDVCCCELPSIEYTQAAVTRKCLL